MLMFKLAVPDMWLPGNMSPDALKSLVAPANALEVGI